MKVSEIVKAVGAAKGVVPESFPEKRLSRIVVAALRAIGESIDAAPEGGRVNVPGLGVFRIRPAAEGKDEAARRVSFRRVQRKAAGKAGAGARGKGKGLGKGRGKGPGKGKAKARAMARKGGAGTTPD